MYNSTPYKDTIHNLCRCCMHQTRKTQQSCFDANLLDVYTKITSRKLQDWNNMPKIICQRCLAQLTSVNDFILKCVDADEKFNTLAQEVLTKENEIKVEELELDDVTEEVFEVHLEDESLEINNTDFKGEKEVPSDDWIDAGLILHINQDSTSQEETEITKNKQDSVPKQPRYKRSRKITSFLTCFTCKLKFKKGARKELDEHYENSKGCKPQEFKCTECPRVYRHVSDLEIHMDVHSTDPKYKCEKCEMWFKQESSLKRHSKNQHGAEGNSFLCEFCPKKFNVLENLQQHLRKYHPEKLNVACPLCPKKFIQEVGLKRHMVTFHPNGKSEDPGYKKRTPKSILCTICGIKVIKGAMALHLNKHQGIRPFECQHCPKKFFTKCELKDHTNRHLGIKPHKCKFCEMAFTESSSLRIHIRKHTGEKPYQCPHCDKRWARKQYLVQHIKTHTGERPYPCPHCSSAFPTKAVLLGHVNTHIKHGTITEEQSSC